MRQGRVVVSFFGMLMGCFVVALGMVLGCFVVGLRCVLVVFGCLLVRFVCHGSPLQGGDLCCNANLRRNLLRNVFGI